MGEIVNLKRARKAKARVAAEKDADANRAKHGIPRHEREAKEAERGRTRQLLDSHKLGHDEDA